MIPLLRLLVPEEYPNEKTYLNHRIGAMLCAGNHRSAKFKFRIGYDEAHCEIYERRPDVFSLKVYKVIGKHSNWKVDFRHPGGMKPPSQGRKDIVIERGGLNAEQVKKLFVRFTGHRLN